MYVKETTDLEAVSITLISEERKPNDRRNEASDNSTLTVGN